MAVEIAPIEVVGLKDALKELNTLDKKLRRQVTKDFKEIMAPVIADAQSHLPQGPPLSQMKYSWQPKSAELLNWDADKVQRNMKAFTSGKKVRDTGLGFKQNVGVFGVRWNGPQATIMEMARRGRLGQNLTSRYGAPSRIFWKAYERNANNVEDRVRQLVGDVMRMVGRGGKI